MFLIFYLAILIFVFYLSLMSVTLLNLDRNKTCILKQGQTPFDVADDEMIKYMDRLKTQQQFASVSFVDFCCMFLVLTREICMYIKYIRY